MPGKIFYRERCKIDEGDKKPRFKVVAITEVDLQIPAKHIRKQELEQIAQAVGADLIELTVEDRGHRLEAEGE